ncbi:sialate O-acetylesterase [Limnoglobus roseus]|uniref:Sialate O-acetylesterase n=1 Tax=Limnoglobus roseus TaxID=2598579 RepID=A0A5C1AAZ9_9BACT|nr:sialate O-acetylesterase [Limnoglobus roseus]QEL16401.1 sialate O-acetylesterase [Limnoglobus roseus]
MTRSILAVMLFVVATGARADHYEVFLVAGQSNCDGRGKAEELTGPLAKWAKPQADVRIAYSCSSQRGPVLTSNGFQPLQPGWSVPPGKPRITTLPGKSFGPEVAFGRGLADHFKGKNVTLIKYAEGGTSLAKDWNPDAKDKLYAAFLTFTRQSLKELKDGKHTFDLRGMIWHQGESDAGLTAEKYEALLSQFITRVRKDLEAPGLPFGVGEVYDNGKRDAVRAAQKSVAGKVPGAFFVSAAGLHTQDQGTHFDAASQITLGERFAAGMVKALGK